MILIAACVLAGLVLLAGAIVTVPLCMGGASGDTLVRVPAGATMQTLRDTLSSRLGKAYGDKVMRAAGMLGDRFHLRHGAYMIRKGTTPLMAARAIGRGAQATVTLSLHDIRTLDELCRRISARLDVTPEAMRRALTDPELLRRHGLTVAQAPALILEDNYDFYWATDPDAIAAKFADNYERYWTEARRDKAAGLGLTPGEAATLASIADEETNQAAEKGRVGRLYWNRLQKGMRLQADPTVKFAIGDFSIRRIRKEHLAVQSPYNTYRNAGLPPGPIRLTSARTISGILDSEPSDDLYMCAKSDFSGAHDFAADFATHQANARRYQAALNRAGIH